METSSTREVEPGPPAAASRQRGASTDHGEPQEVEAPPPGGGRVQGADGAVGEELWGGAVRGRERGDILRIRT